MNMVISEDMLDYNHHVNYKEYLELFEIARRNYAEKRNISEETFTKEFGLVAVIPKIIVEYKKELFLGDAVTIRTLAPNIGNTSMVFSQYIRRNEWVVASLEILYVTIGTESRMPTRIPDEAKRRLLS